MKKIFTASKQVDHMPLYNRSHGQSKSRGDGDIALSTHKKQVFLEKEVKSDDTLQSIALEFNVPVSELKRINNIHKDNEIFARKIIKVPSNPLSILLEKEYFGEEAKLSQPSLSPQPKQEICDIIVETINNSNCVAKNPSENPAESGQDKYLHLHPASEDLQESASLLTTTVERRTNKVLSCSGADWGISWHALILVTLVLGVGGPVLYVFWFLLGRKGKPEAR